MQAKTTNKIPQGAAGWACWGAAAAAAVATVVFYS